MTVLVVSESPMTRESAGAHPGSGDGPEAISDGPDAITPITRRRSRARQGGLPELSDQAIAPSQLAARIAEECARSASGGLQFAVLRIRAVDPVDAPTFDAALATVLRGSDRISYTPPDADVLVPETGPEVALRMATRVQESLAERGLRVRAAIACFPDDGVTADALSARLAVELGDPPAGSSGADPLFLDRSPAMVKLRQLVERVAVGNINVLLLGETGVGKEVYAERLHNLSPRASNKLLRLNCAAFSETLLESELFGYEKGAFTGAVQSKPGLLETADGGSVFLDEIGDLPLSLQAKLLRVLEDRKVMRVGGLTPRPIDVRFIAATHRDLEGEGARGAFRQDLYYRLNGVQIHVPPLRQRVEEVAPLARAFVRQAAAGLGVRTPELSPDAIAMLERHRWPGNVRELRNAMERAVLLCSGGAISLEHLPIEKLLAARPPEAPAGDAAQAAAGPRAMAAQAAEDEGPRKAVSLRAGRRTAEQHLIVEALERTVGNQTRAAKLLGISRRTLISRMEEFGLPRPRKPNQR
jgi:DNA-binding NtrC family response regulator